MERMTLTAWIEAALKETLKRQLEKTGMLMSALHAKPIADLNGNRGHLIRMLQGGRHNGFNNSR